jgi:small neutral amino acid transporter SnatA (MarC family)
LIGPASPISAAPATSELTIFPTSSAHPDFVTGAIFVVIFALLLTFAYAIRVLRRRRHRWD